MARPRGFATDGDLWMWGELLTQQTISADGGTDEWILDNSLSITALVELSGANAGRMKIKGTLYEGWPVSGVGGVVFVLRDSEDDAVAAIDASGNLFLKGYVRNW